MSIAKGYYTEPEAYKPQHKSRANTTAQRRRQGTNLPGRIVDEPTHKRQRVNKWRLVLHRLRRFWVAFKFQAHRYTMGVFERNTLIKIGVLAVGAYLLLLTDLGQSASTPETYMDEPVITALEEEKMPLEAPAIKPKPTKSAAPAEPATKPKSSAAPVGHSELFAKQANDYIQRYHKIAIGEMQKFGIPASISLAQGLIESRAGTSKLAVNNNNHFGIKCFSRNCRKGHCTNFTDDSHKDFFRKFKSPWESWRAHSELLASGRYASLKRHGKDYRKWAYGLKSIGYATDRGYAEKIIGIIERYDLHQYDR
ncbi:MAG: glucosaminidase domain-containing protein [Saprospiraceae bacterium]|nr:glucosaminidase domain-containing protein [Saprospiraceae bacterium]